MLIEEIRVQGYKSLVDATLHVRPLTLLAGTNSSGKSSIMQPLLLIKQTMEAPYQPAGALVLGGAHVQAETAGELVSKIDNVNEQIQFVFIGSESDKASEQPLLIETVYEREEDIFNLVMQSVRIKNTTHVIELKPMSSWEELSPQLTINFLKSVFNDKKHNGRVEQRKAFLQLNLIDEDGLVLMSAQVSAHFQNSVASLMHIPGLRVIPKRTYRTTYFQNQITGTFDIYAAGTISQWQQQENNVALTKLNHYLRRLGLTDSVTAKVKNANEVELSVSRLPAGAKAKPRKADMVNIADVGIGVSQVLPILVALIAAQEGQIVYVEQPELHLHPRAQVVMAELLAEAANRGVRVIVETHSSLLLLTVQTMVAEGRMKPEDVGLHWFERDAKGATKVTLAEVDENGAYGNWPEDFGDVELTAQSAYLNANTKRQPFTARPDEA